MTMTTDLFYVYVLLAANAILVAAAGIAVLRFERRWRRIDAFWDSPTGTALNDSVNAEMGEQVEATRRLEKRLGELQRTVKLLDMRSPKQSPPTEQKPSMESAVRNLPIENAVRMARFGASVDELTRTCGLNVGEARLMQKLHGRAAESARTH